MIDFLGSQINNEASLYYWCHKNSIPVFCPGLTDGSLGDNLYFHTYRNPVRDISHIYAYFIQIIYTLQGLIIDVIEDIRRVNDIAVKAKMSGMIILGGGKYRKFFFSSFSNRFQYVISYFIFYISYFFFKGLQNIIHAMLIL